MRLNRVKNTKRNIKWGLIEKIIGLFFQFLSRTLLIKILGDEFLGASSVIISIMQLLNFIETGILLAITYTMYDAIATNNHDKLCALLNYVKKLYRKMGFIVLFTGILLMPFLHYFIDFNSIPNYNFYIIYLIYLFDSFVLYEFFSYKKVICNAYQRNDISYKIRTIASIIKYTLQLSIFFIFKNYYLYVIIFPIITALINYLYYYSANKYYKDIVPKGHLSKCEKHKIYNHMKGLIISKVCDISRNSLDSIFLSMFTNLTVVAIYSNYFTIFIIISNLLRIIYESIISGIGNTVALDNVSKNYKEYNKLKSVYTWLTGFCTVSLLIMYQPFMELWLGKNYLFSYSSVILLSIYFYFCRINDVRDIYLNANGLFWESRHYIIMETLGNIILNYVLAKFFGINGILLATIITIVFINYIFGNKLLYDKYFINKKFINCIRKDISLSIPILLVCILLGTISSLININPLFKLIVCGILSLLGNILLIAMYKKDYSFKEGLLVVINKGVSSNKLKNILIKIVGESL